MLRKNSNTVPRNLLVPPRVAMETLAPELRPYSAVALEVVMLDTPARYRG